MAWTDAVDVYCERTGPELWAEPFNALSNLGFILAGGLLLRDFRSRFAPGPVPWTLNTLAVLIILVGLGSGAFHTVAQKWAELLDVGFIALFIHFFVVCFLRHVGGLSWGWSLLGIPGFVALAWLVTAPFPAGAFNGSVGYLPALVGLLLFTSWLVLGGHRGAGTLLGSALVFGLSLGLRSADQRWCDAFPLGTHWAWHLLNALVLSLALLALAQGVSESRSAAAASR